MANEFKIKNGLIVDQGGVQITGSLSVSGSFNLSDDITIDGNISGSGNAYIAGNVGIGTSSPTAKLHVSGSGGGSDVLLVEPAGAPTVSLKSNSTITDYSGLSVGNKYLLLTKDSNAIFQNIQGGLRFANGLTAKSVITENGYFGIGFNTTTGIDYPLDVKGDARISGSGNFTNGLTVSGSTKFGDSSDDVHQFTGSLQQSGSDSYFLGNVGIGTTSPNYKLEIEGTTDFGNTATYNNGAAGLISWNAGTKFKVKGQSGHALSLGANGTEDYVWIATDGNVGIGTTTPQRLFDVYNSTTSGIAASFGARIANNNFSGISFGYVEQANTSYRKSALVFERTETHGGGPNASGKIHFLLNNNSSTSATALTHAVVTIDSVGTTIGSARMGIGTRFPTASLHISGTVATDNLMRVQSTTGAEYFFISSSGNVGIGTTSPPERLTVQGNISGSGNAYIAGNVGIGTTSPGVKLDIQQDTTGDLLARVWNTNASGTGDSILRIANNGNNANGNRIEFSDAIYYPATISGDRSQGIVFRTSATGSNPITIPERMRITSGGNVGIGTTSPSYKLDVSGSGRFTDGLIVTGSTDFGDSSDDIHSFTGSIQLSGSFTVNNQYTLPQTSASAASSSLMDDGSGNLFFGPVVTAGTYIPSASHLVNLDSVDATHELMYSYIAPILTIGGRIGTNATAGTGVHSFRLSLPSFVINNFSDDEQAAGIAKDQEGDRGFTIEALSGSNQIFVYNNSNTNTANATYRFTCVIHVQ